MRYVAVLVAVVLLAPAPAPAHSVDRPLSPQDLRPPPATQRRVPLRVLNAGIRNGRWYYIRGITQPVFFSKTFPLPYPGCSPLMQPSQLCIERDDEELHDPFMHP